MRTIITFHSGYNHGAIMQSYVLSKWLNARILDYTDADFMRLNQGVPNKQAMQKFINTLPCTSKQKSIEQCINTLNKGKLAIFGSDQIWRFHFHQGRQVGGLDVPIPNIYFCPTRVTSPSIAFAAATGDRNWAEIPADIVRAIKTRLKRLSIVTVRDKHTQNFLRYLDIGSQLLPDPLFCEVDIYPDYDVSSKYKLPPKFSVIADPDKPYTSFKSEFPIIKLFELPLSPPEWFALVRDAQSCVTSRMHGLIACLLGNTPCQLVDERPKTLELAETFQLDKGWDYSRISDKISEYRERHRSFRQLLNETFPSKRHVRR